MQTPTAALAVNAPFASAAMANAQTQISFYVDGVPTVFNDSTGRPFINAAGRTMIPVRAAIGAIGGRVVWDSAARIVNTHKDNVTVAIPIGINELVVNGRTIKTDTAAVILRGRTYLPLSAVLGAYGYAVEWVSSAKSVRATRLIPTNINGGTTGIFDRKQLHFSGFDGVRGEFTLPYVPELEKGDCPYVYFGIEWEGGGFVEGGFQFVESATHPLYNKWTVFMRQGNEWRWNRNVVIEQGETCYLSFYAEYIAGDHTDLVMVLDGNEVIRKKSTISSFERTSVKAVVSMAMSKTFDGQNCYSSSVGARIADVEVRERGSHVFRDFGEHPLFSRWRPNVGQFGMWYGTTVCVPAYIHFEPDGKVSIFRYEAK